MKYTKTLCLAGLLFFGAAALAQEVQFDYDRSANFSSYRTYHWVDSKAGRAPNQLTDQNIKRAIDEQLAAKGLQRVETGGDLQVVYQAAVDHEKQFDGFGSGPRWYGTTRVSTSTIEIGKLVVDLVDPAKKQLVWRGSAEKTLDIKKDPEKNYRNLQKEMAKLFQNYPPRKHQEVVNDPSKSRSIELREHEAGEEFQPSRDDRQEGFSGNYALPPVKLSPEAQALKIRYPPDSQPLFQMPWNSNQGPS